MRLRRAEYCASVIRSQVDFRRYDPLMGTRTGAVALGILLIAGGLVWMAQGLDLAFAPSSFMTADRLWVFLGALAALAGSILIVCARPKKRLP